MDYKMNENIAAPTASVGNQGFEGKDFGPPPYIK
jgi:hypothetical protein